MGPQGAAAGFFLAYRCWDPISLIQLRPQAYEHVAQSCIKWGEHVAQSCIKWGEQNTSRNHALNAVSKTRRAIMH